MSRITPQEAWENGYKAGLENGQAESLSTYKQELLEGLDKIPTMYQTKITTTNPGIVEERIKYFPRTAEEYKDQVKSLIEKDGGTE